MIHAPAALGRGPRELRPGWVRRWLCRGAPIRDVVRTLSSAGPVRTQAASRPPPGCERLLCHQAMDPEPPMLRARVCAPPPAPMPAPGEAKEAPVLERAASGTHRPGRPPLGPVPQAAGGPGEGALAERAPRAAAPDSSQAPRGQVRPGGRGLRLPARSPGPAARPAPRARPAAQLDPSWKPRPGGRTRAWRRAAAAAAKEAAAAAQLRRARRLPHGRAWTAGGARAWEQREDSRRRRRPARESKVGAGGSARARGPGGAAAGASARRALAGRMGGRAPGPPPPVACALAGLRGRGAAQARPLGRRVAVGSPPGRSP